MRHIVILSANEARQLAHSINFTPHLSGLRVTIDGDYAKFKVNQLGWSPPMGQLDPLCEDALDRAAIDRVKQQLKEGKL